MGPVFFYQAYWNVSISLNKCNAIKSATEMEIKDNLGIFVYQDCLIIPVSRGGSPEGRETSVLKHFSKVAGWVWSSQSLQTDGCEWIS